VLKQPTIVVVTRQTRLQGVVRRRGTKGQARFLLMQAHAQELARHEPDQAAAAVAQREDDAAAMAEASFDLLEGEHETYQATLDRVRRELDLGYPVRLLDREYLPTYIFEGCPVVVVVGQDGLVANTAKYVGDTPIVGVNPDPKRVDGILATFSVKDVRKVVRAVLDRKAKCREVTLAEVNLNDGQKLLAFNDFFLGAASHVSARYTLRCGDQSEAQSSSGMIVSTGAGSTGWLSSVFNMADGFARWFQTPLPPRPTIAWEDRRLFWAVREPFRSKVSGAEMVAGVLEEHDEIVVESLMPLGGVIFSDGIEADALEFNSGTIARFSVSSQRARLVAK
jgi:NAD kinase